MNPRTERTTIAGPAGPLECAIDAPAHGSARGLAVLCHPHPLHGGTLDNKVVQTLAVIQAHRGLRQPLLLGGFSFGGSVASRAAARLPAAERADRLVLVGPAVQTFEMAPVPADALLIHGEADEVVPLAAVFDWARPQSLPVTVVPGAGHFFHGQLTLLKHIVTAALQPHNAT